MPLKPGPRIFLKGYEQLHKNRLAAQAKAVANRRGWLSALTSYIRELKDDVSARDSRNNTKATRHLARKGERRVSNEDRTRRSWSAYRRNGATDRGSR